MSWRTLATGVIVIVGLLLLGAVLAEPFVEIMDMFDTVDTSGQFDHESTTDGWVDAWFDMILVGVFGIMAWVIWRVVRRELQRGRI